MVPALAFGTMLLTVASPASATEGMLANLTKRTLFETCLDAMNGSLDYDDAAALSKAGLKRAPIALEKKLTHPTKGQPKVAGAAVGGDTISMSVYPVSTTCTVMVQGVNGAAAFSAVREHVRSYPSLFKPDPEQTKKQGIFDVEAFKLELEDGTNFRALLMTPPQEDLGSAFIASIGLTKD
jgi:hypothetical protein